MAAYWDGSWDDEEWLKRQNVATLHSIYNRALNEGRDISHVHGVMKQRLLSLSETDITDAEDSQITDMFGYVSFMEKDDPSKTNTDYDNPRSWISEFVGKQLERIKDAFLADEGPRNPARHLNRCADVINANILSLLSRKLGRVETPEIRDMLNYATDLAEIKTNTGIYASRENIRLGDTGKATIRTVVSYHEVEDAIVQGDSEIAQYVQSMRRRLANYAGLNLADRNDVALATTVGNDLAVYASDGSLNPLYAECQLLADQIKFARADGISGAKHDELSKLYKQQLLANAAQRAAQNILRDDTFLIRNTTEDAIQTAYKEEIGRQFERSVVLASLAGNEAVQIELNKINRDGSGNIVYGNGSDPAITQAIMDALAGNTEINPLAVNLDTYTLDKETDKLSKELKAKRINPEGLSFWKKTKQVVSAVKENLIKKGGWKKVAANITMFGGAAALMAGTTPMVIAGAAIYAGWSATNAWVMPAYDMLNNEMYATNVKGFKARLAYIKANFSRALAAKKEEPGFKSRAWWRTAEGVLTGGLTGGLVIGGVGGWLKTLARQGAMGLGKTGSLIRSWFGVKKAKQQLDDRYSVANYKALQTAEGYLKQDKVALGAVIGGAIVADYIKYDLENGGPVAGLASSLLHNVEDAGTVNLKINEDGQILDAKGNPLLDAEGNPIVAKEGTVPEFDEETGQYTVETENGQVMVNPETGEVQSVTPEVKEEAVEEQQKTEGEEVTEQQVEESTPFDTGKLTGDEQKMYLNSISKWDNNALANRIAALKAEGSISQEQLETIQEALGNLKNGKDVVQLFYDHIQNGFDGAKVESVPEGMSPVEYVDKLTRLMQFAPVQHKEAITIMIKDLMCDTFVPSENDKALVATALSHIVYEKGTMRYVAIDDCGNPCVKVTSMFGQYVGPEKKMEIGGEELPVRNHNRTTGLEITDGCEGKYKFTYIKGKVDCGCQEVVYENPYQLDASVAQNNGLSGINMVEEPAPATNIKVNFTDPSTQATATYAGNGSNYPVDQTVPEGTKVLRMDGDGKIRMWQQGATVEGSDVTSQPGGVETIHSIALNINMNNLGKAHITDDAGNLNIQFGSGKDTLSFVLDKKTGEMHTFIGKQEVVLDQATTRQASAAIAGVMKESGLDQRYNLTFGAETEQNNDNLSSVASQIEKIKANREATLNGNINGVRQNGATETTVESNVPEPKGTMKPVSVTLSESSQAAMMSGDAKITYANSDGGNLIFNVEGVEGVTQVSLPKMEEVNFGANPEVTYSAGENEGSFNVDMTTADGNKLTVMLDGKETKVLMNGKEVILSPDSAEKVEDMTTRALQENNVVVKGLNLTAYPKGTLGNKLYGIYKTAMQAVKGKGANAVTR